MVWSNSISYPRSTSKSDLSLSFWFAIDVIINITETNLGRNLKAWQNIPALHPHGAPTALALYKVLISFYHFEKWTWQQMLVFLLEIKCLNNSQKCPFSPLDNKVSALPSTLWHWSRCPSLSNGVQGLPWPVAELAKKALGFSNLPRLFVTLNLKKKKKKSSSFYLDVLFLFFSSAWMSGTWHCQRQGW